MNDLGKSMGGLTFQVIFNGLLIFYNPVLSAWTLFWITLLNICVTAFVVVSYIRWMKY